MPPAVTIFETEMFLHDLLSDAGTNATTGTSPLHRSEAQRLWFQHCNINILVGSTLPVVDTLHGVLLNGDSVLLGEHFHGNINSNWVVAQDARERQPGDDFIPFGFGANVFYSEMVTDTLEPMAGGLTPRAVSPPTNMTFSLTNDTGNFRILIAHEFGHHTFIARAGVRRPPAVETYWTAGMGLRLEGVEAALSYELIDVVGPRLQLQLGVTPSAF